MMRSNYLKEAIELFDDGDRRSFNEIYAGQEDLFENVDDIIHPKFKKLFEATYQAGNVQQKRLKEDQGEFDFDPQDPADAAAMEWASIFWDGYSKGSLWRSVDPDNPPQYGNEETSGVIGMKRLIRRMASGEISVDEAIERAKKREMVSELDMFEQQAAEELGRKIAGGLRESRRGRKLPTKVREGYVNLFKRIYEESNPSGAANNNPKSGPTPGGDGVPSGHNPRLSKGPTRFVRQSGAKQDDDSKLGNEPAYGYGNGPKAPNRG
jgi:hypothetical protein